MLVGREQFRQNYSHFQQHFTVNWYAAVGNHAESTPPRMITTVPLPKTVRRLIGKPVSLQCLFTGRSGNKADYSFEFFTNIRF